MTKNVGSLRPRLRAEALLRAGTKKDTKSTTRLKLGSEDEFRCDFVVRCEACDLNELNNLNRYSLF